MAADGPLTLSLSHEGRGNPGPNWYIGVGAILVIALGEGLSQKGEYKIRPDSEPQDLLSQSDVVQFSCSAGLVPAGSRRYSSAALPSSAKDDHKDRPYTRDTGNCKPL